MVAFLTKLKVALAFFSLSVLTGIAAGQSVRHVVVIGVDGLGAEGVRRVNPPNLKRLMEQGAWTLKARAVIPTVSSPNWASMMMGAGPAQHGVTSNDWQPNKFEIEPVCKGSGGIFPTIYGLLREQRRDAVIGVFHDWNDYGRLFERQAVDVIVDAKDHLDAAAQAIAFFKQKRPTFTFIHFDHVDHAGHDIGWRSREYDDALLEADRLVGEVIKGLRDAEMFDETVLIFTADHGGVGTKHGGLTMSEIEIPWVIAGPGIAAGEISAPVNTYDTAATVAHLFGLKTPDCWIAKPVLSAFKSKDGKSNAVK